MKCSDKLKTFLISDIAFLLAKILKNFTLAKYKHNTNRSF